MILDRSFKIKLRCTLFEQDMLPEVISLFAPPENEVQDVKKTFLDFPIHVFLLLHFDLSGDPLELLEFFRLLLFFQ